MKRACAATLWACVLPVTSAMAQSISTTQPAVPQITLASLQGINYSNPMSAFPINSPPIGGFVPRVVYGLTQERLGGYSDQDAQPSSSIGTPSLPVSGQKYYTAILDSGAQSTIISNLDGSNQGFNLAGSNLLTSNTQDVVGLTGDPVSVSITKPLGVYVSGFGSASVGGGTISPGTTTFAGQTNVSVLSDQVGADLPTVVGAPLLGQYRTTIKNSEPHHLTVGTQTFRTPQIEFGALGTSNTTGYGTMALGRAPAGFFSFVTNPPSYFQSSLFSPDPILPTNWYSLLGTANFSGTGGTQTGKNLLFDTGAEVSVVSVQLAADLGFHVDGDTPDFKVDVQGVGGTLTLNGFYLDTMTVSTSSQTLTWHHVPFLVANLPHPDAGNGGPDYLDGVMGMNLFNDRNILLNGTPSFVGISTQWQWNNASGGTWSNPANWTLALPSGMDTQANFYGAITAAKTVVVDSGGFTVGTMSFDNVNRYTLNGPGRITLQVSVDQAQINVSSGSHTINAPMTLANDTIVTVWPPSSRLTINSDVTATGVNILKQGPGMLEMKNVRAGGLMLNEGTVMITAGGGTNGTSRVSSLLFAPTVGTTAMPAHLDLNNNAMIVDYSGASPLPTIRQYLANGYNGGAWNGDNGINSSLANSNGFALGSAEKSALGLTSFGGQSLSGDAVLIKYTYSGDANFDGLVDVADLAIAAAHWNTSGDVWTSGDFNYDGSVNIDDLKLLASNWLAGIGNPLQAPTLSEALLTLGLPQVEVPEPEHFAGLLAAAIFVVGGSRLRARPRRV